MKKIVISTSLVAMVVAFSGCVNKHGLSLKYYSDCDEYYDAQGYYHKDCGEDDIVTYKGVGDGVKKIFTKEKKDPTLIEGEPTSF